jgi:hypothetical protein
MWLPVRSCFILILLCFIHSSLRGQDAPDTVRNFSSETSSLVLWATKKNVYEGECTTITLAFLVKSDNLLRLQFHNLGQQLYRMHLTSLETRNGFLVSNNIVDIHGQDTVINHSAYTIYKIFEAAYCPYTSAPMRFPALKLYMAVLKRDDKIEKLVEYSTAPLKIDVRPLLPAAGIEDFHKYKMVGSFSLHERVLDERLTAGQPFVYELKIKGAGFLFPLEPPRPQRMHLTATLVDMVYNDTIVGGVLHSEKLFTYWITPEAEGTYDFTNLVSFSFFDPLSKRRETIASSMKVVVYPGSGYMDAETSPNVFFSQNNFIVIDASESMMIEDYLPTRLSAVREGVKKFLLKRKSCDIGVITFAVEARHVDLSLGDSCYARTQFHRVTYLPKRGTAIGDALWFAQVSAKPGPALKKIVLIGDGDNTAGSLNSLYAAAMANENNVRIYTIGIGSAGPVPFRRNEAGVRYMIDDTFSDRELKMISQATGGKYYHPRDAEQVTAALVEIFGM